MDTIRTRMAMYPRRSSRGLHILRRRLHRNHRSRSGRRSHRRRSRRIHSRRRSDENRDRSRSRNRNWDHGGSRRSRSEDHWGWSSEDRSWSS
jgi:hypothetical protein